VTAVLALSVAACSSGTERAAATRDSAAASEKRAGAPAAPARSGCGYITEAEASVALAQPSRYRREPSGGPTCSVEPALGDAFHGTTVTYRISRGSTAQYDFFAAQKRSQPIGGLGDRALWLAAGATRGNLVVVHGTDVVTVTISDFSAKGKLQERARAFAQKVLGRM
jgi:hypothetical protein